MSGRKCTRCEEFRRALADPKNAGTLRDILRDAQRDHLQEELEFSRRGQ